MNKIIYYLVMFFTGLALQFTFMQYVSIKGIAPNILLVMLTSAALLRGARSGQVLGFFWGLAWDVYSVDLFGCHAFALTIIGFLVGKLSRKWDEQKVSSQMVLVFTASILNWGLIYLSYRIFNPEVYVFKMNYIVIIQPFINALIAPVVFKVISVAMDLFAEKSRI